MNTFVIYDENGEIIMTQSGEVNFPTKIGTSIIEVPKDKMVSHVDIKTGEVILVDRPKSDEEARLEALEKQMAVLLGEE